MNTPFSRLPTITQAGLVANLLLWSLTLLLIAGIFIPGLGQIIMAFVFTIGPFIAVFTGLAVFTFTIGWASLRKARELPEPENEEAVKISWSAIAGGLSHLALQFALLLVILGFMVLAALEPVLPFYYLSSQGRAWVHQHLQQAHQSIAELQKHKSELPAPPAHPTEEQLRQYSSESGETTQAYLTRIGWFCNTSAEWRDHFDSFFDGRFSKELVRHYLSDKSQDEPDDDDQPR